MLGPRLPNLMRPVIHDSNKTSSCRSCVENHAGAGYVESRITSEYSAETNLARFKKTLSTTKHLFSILQTNRALGARNAPRRILGNSVQPHNTPYAATRRFALYNFKNITEAFYFSRKPINENRATGGA